MTILIFLSRNLDFCQHLSTLSPDLEVLTSVDTFGCRATSRVQSSGVADCTVLKGGISAFRITLRQQNRFSSRRDRSKNVKFNGFWTKSTLTLQIRLISMISSSTLTNSSLCLKIRKKYTTEGGETRDAKTKNGWVGTARGLQVKIIRGGTGFRDFQV